MTRLPFMPIAVSDVISETGGMDTEAFGAFTLLQYHMWLNEALLPNDDKVLARYARLTPAKWKRVRASVMPLFRPHETRDGYITQTRLRHEYVRALEKSAKAAKNGRRGGEATARKNLHLSVASARSLPNQNSRQSDGWSAGAGASNGKAPIPKPNNSLSSQATKVAREGREIAKRALEEESGEGGAKDDSCEPGEATDKEAETSSELIKALERRAAQRREAGE